MGLIQRSFIAPRRGRVSMKAITLSIWLATSLLVSLKKGLTFRVDQLTGLVRELLKVYSEAVGSGLLSPNIFSVQPGPSCRLYIEKAREDKRQ